MADTVLFRDVTPAEESFRTSAVTPVATQD
jgi:hypothetical protein